MVILYQILAGIRVHVYSRNFAAVVLCHLLHLHWCVHIVSSPRNLPLQSSLFREMSVHCLIRLGPADFSSVLLSIRYWCARDCLVLLCFSWVIMPALLLNLWWWPEIIVALLGDLVFRQIYSSIDGPAEKRRTIDSRSGIIFRLRAMAMFEYKSS